MAFIIQGLEEVMNKIEDMGKKVETVQNKVVNAQADILLDTMQHTIRVDTGKTRDSLKASNVLTRDGQKYKLVGAYKCLRAHIVRFLERGCKKWKGKQQMIEASKEVVEKEVRG